MAGAESLAPGDAHRRVVRLQDGTLLNRDWEDIVYSYPAIQDGFSGTNAGSNWFRRVKFNIWIGYDF